MERPVVVALAHMGPADEDLDKQLSRLLALTDQAARASAKLCCFPELALTSYFPAARLRDPLSQGLSLGDQRLQPLLARAAEAGMGLVLGYGESDGVVLHNTAAVFHGDGTFPRGSGASRSPGPS